MEETTDQDENPNRSAVDQTSVALEISKGVISTKSFTSLKYCFDKTTFNKVTEDKLKQMYGTISAEFLTLFINEQISKRCLERDIKFFKMCRDKPDLGLDAGFWHFLFREEQYKNEMLDNVISVLNQKSANQLTNIWRNNLIGLIPYFATEKAEKELFKTITEWLSSPQLTLHQFQKWKRVLQGSRNLEILLSDLRSLRDSGRWYELYEQALEEITTTKLLPETNEALFSFLKDFFHLDVKVIANKQRRERLIVAQKVLFLSTAKIHEHLKRHPNVQEINIYAKKLLFVDCDLQNEFVHGKNLAIVAGHIIVLKRDAIFDVSGINKKKQLRPCAVSKKPEAGKDGEPGRDGLAGESSGNVTIVAGLIENPTFLTVKMFGGSGEGGQNGSPGGDGTVGKGVTKKDFDALCVKYPNLYWKSWSWFADYHPGQNFELLDSRANDPKNKKEQYLFRTYRHPDGRRIEYSYAGRRRAWALYTRYELYFVVYGARGIPPGIGGQNGFGGEGGRQGEYIATTMDGRQLRGIVWKHDLGANGNNKGVCGETGSQGKCGNDMAFLDRSEVTIGGFQCYRGLNEKNKLNKKFFNVPTSDRKSRFNGFLKYEENQDDCYVWFDEAEPDKFTTDKKENKRSESDRNSESKAVSQQAILMENIVAEFNSCFAEDDVQLVLAEIALEPVYSQEETGKDQQMEEKLTVLRERTENLEEHKSITKAQKPDPEQLYQIILNEKSTSSLVYIKVLLDKVFQVCIDCVPIQKQVEVLFANLENEKKWKKEMQNGVLSDGMNQEQLKAFVSEAKLKWKDKLSLSTMKPHIDDNLKAMVQLVLNMDELKDVVSSPLDGEFWKKRNSPKYCEKLVDNFFAKIPKFWVYEDALREVNKIHKKLSKLTILDKFAKDDLDWSDQKAVLNYMKSFMTSGEKEKEAEEAEVAADAMSFEDLKESEDTPDQKINQAKKTWTERTRKYLASKMNFEKNSQFSEVALYMQENKADIDKLFERFRKLLEEDLDLKDRFTLKLDYTGYAKPIGSHKTSLIFMRYFSEEILKFSSKLFRYHLKYRRGVSTPTNWKHEEDLVFEKFGAFMLAIRKHKIVQIDKSFRKHMQTEGLKSASYRLLFSEENNVNLQVFCESGYAKVRLVENLNVKEEKLIRLFLSKQGDVTGLSPCEGVRRLKQQFVSFQSEIPLLLSKDSDLKKFVVPFSKDTVTEWMDSATTALSSNYPLRFLRRLFEVRGFDMTIDELQFLLNTVMDCVCLKDLPVENLCSRMLTKHGEIESIPLALRIFFTARGECEPLTGLTERISRIKDKRLQALFGSKLHELNWNQYKNELHLVCHMLEHAENSFSQLDQRPLKEWIDIAKCQKWDSYQPLNAEYGTAGYFFILLDSASHPESQQLRVMVDRLKTHGCFVLEKMISRLTYLIYNNELKFAETIQQSALKLFSKASQIVESLRGEKGKSKIEMIHQEQLQHQWIGTLRRFPEWNIVFPKSRRTLKELIKLTTNFHDSGKEKNERVEKLQNIERQIMSAEDKCMKVLNQVDDVLFKLREIRLRDTQKMAILSAYTHPKNLLCQVNTGEGKSFIIASLAILKVELQGGFVDIITSSSVLAQRDAEHMKDIYEAFNIQAGHNCDERTEERKKAYTCSVVYGDIAHFERDHLLHNFYKRNLLGNRQKNCVIVDEGDSMCLDNGSNMLYLSHCIPGLELLESLFVFIYKEIYTQQTDEKSSLSERIRKAVLVDLFGMVTKNDIAQLLIHEKQLEHVSTVWRQLVKNKIVNDEGVIQMPTTETNFLQFGQDLIDSCGVHLTKRLMGMLTVVQNRKQEIMIPSYLHTFVLQHLREFIDSALKGFFMQQKDEYVVDVDRSGQNGDLHPIVTIIDKSTGTDLSSSQWSEGLHQFLQLKHGCRLTSMSLKAVFISNISYLKSYNNIYGFSGTLGSQVESDSLQELYNADVMRIPTYIPKEFNENTPILARREEHWIQALYDEIYNQFDAGRSVLLVCKSIANVEHLHGKLCDLAENSVLKNDFKKALLYKRDSDTDDFERQLEGKLKSRKLIISTNLAGRGTDIKLHQELVDCGGLHVIVSFIPQNSRIEDQAYGRAARCGEPGSGQIIALIDKQASGASNIFQLKQFRDNAEVHRLRSLKQFYDYHIAVEEMCLQLFQEHCSEALASTYNTSEEKLPTKNQVLYFALLDEWAMWLDREADNIKQCEKNANDTEKQAIIASAKSFLSSHPIPAEWNGNIDNVDWLQRPQPLLTIALILIEENNIGEALRLLQRIADQFSDFAAEANYYMGVIVQRQIRVHRKFKRTEEEFEEKEEKEGFWKYVDNTWKWIDNKRLWIGNNIDDGKNWVQNQFQKINNLENSPEYFVEIDEDSLDKANALFVRARALFMKRIRHKRFLLTVVNVLQQDKTLTLSRGFADQHEAFIAVVESFIGNIDDILGHVPTPSDLTLSGEEDYVSVPRAKALRQAGILSPVVLMDSVDNELLQPVSTSCCVPTWLLANFLQAISRNQNGTEYEGKKVVDKEMFTTLPLPSAIGFWTSLRRAGCFLNDERFYIAVKKTAEFAPLKKETSVVPELDPFDLQLTENNFNDYHYYDVHDEAGKVKNDYENNLALREMMDYGTAYIEIIATLNPLVVTTTPKLDQFDFINAEILEEELGLEESEAKWILTKLVDANMLTEILVDVETEQTTEKDPPGKTTIGTCCTTVFVEETRIDLDVFPENMRDSIAIVFARHFSYGYALKALGGSLQAAMNGKQVRHRILLPSSPYTDLFEDMLNSGVLIHGRVTHDVEEIYKPENPYYITREDYIPKELYEKLSKMTPWIKINKCKLQSTQEYMRKKIVPASAEVRSALANGMRQIATIQKPNVWRWFFGIFVDFCSYLATSAFSRVGSKLKTVPVLVPAVVGSMLYFMSIFKNNRKAFAKTNVSFTEEFSVLRESHEVSIKKKFTEKKHQEINKELQLHIDDVLKTLRHFVLSHSLLTFNEMPVAEIQDLFRDHINNSQLLHMLRQTVTNFLSTQTRKALQEEMIKLQTKEKDKCPNSFDSSDLLETVIAFATALIFDVNKSIRLKNRNRKTKLPQIDTAIISRLTIRDAENDSAHIEECLMSQEKTLRTVLCKEMHAVLERIIDEAMETKIRPLVNEMMAAWRARNTPSSGELCLDETTKQKKSAEYSAERLAKVHTSDYMARDLHNIFIKMCFREQRPEVLCHMVRYNYPMSAHCARIITEGVLMLTDELNVPIGQFQLTLKRNKQDIFWITAGRKDRDGTCFISLPMKEDCFYVTEKDSNERMTGQSSGLFENLCVQVEEIATEFSLGSDIFRNRLENAIKERRLDPAWKFSENWLSNEKLLCSVPF